MAVSPEAFVALACADTIPALPNEQNPGLDAISHARYVFALGGGAVAGVGGPVAQTANADADADFVSTAIGLITNSRIGGLRASTSEWVRLRAETIATESGRASNADFHLLTGAALLGVDSSDSTLRAIEARTAAADTDFAKALRAAAVNARVGVYRVASGDYVRWSCDTPAVIEGESPSGNFWSRAAACLVGRDTNDTTLRVVETRKLANRFAVSTLYRLFVDSRVRGYETATGFEDPIICTSEISGTTGSMGLSASGRESGYYASLRGRRYVITGSDAGTIAGAVGFTATTPSFLLVAGATKEVILRRFIATLVTPGAATSSQLVVKTDTADRFSAGGTARAPQTMNNGNALATGISRNLELPTATAEGGGTRQVASLGGGIVAGSMIDYEPDDGLVVAASGSLLFYLVNATGGANYVYMMEFEEVNAE